MVSDQGATPQRQSVRAQRPPVTDLSGPTPAPDNGRVFRPRKRIALVPCCAILGSCVRPTPCPTTAPATAPPPSATLAGAPPSPTRPAQKEREKIAVLPFQDEQLFRSERRALREKLAAALGKALRDYELVPLTEVDAELRPTAKSGERCAFDGVPNHRRVSGKGWLTTELVHVSGFKEKGEELWVQVNGWQSLELTLAAPWNSKLPRVERYESAFTSLKALPEGGGLLGGLGGRFMPRGEVKAGTLTLCQRAGFTDCAPETKAFSDKAAEMAACFAGADHERRHVLFEGASRCELEDLDDASGPAGKREACLCAAVAKSAGASATRGRSRLIVEHEAKDLAGKSRPEIRVVEASTNLHSEADWHSSDKKGQTPVHQLTVDNVDSVAPALARCALPAGSLVLAEVSVSDAGTVQAARVLSGAKTKRDAACVEKALAAGAYACTSDGKPATVRLALAWSD